MSSKQACSMLVNSQHFTSGGQCTSTVLENIRRFWNSLRARVAYVWWSRREDATRTGNQSNNSALFYYCTRRSLTAQTTSVKVGRVTLGGTSGGWLPLTKKWTSTWYWLAGAWGASSLAIHRLRPKPRRELLHTSPKSFCLSLSSISLSSNMSRHDRTITLILSSGSQSTKAPVVITTSQSPSILPECLQQSFHGVSGRTKFNIGLVFSNDEQCLRR